MNKPGLMVTLATARELIAFAWRGKNWWLTPLIVLVLLLSLVVVVLESSAIAPFIYALF
jgi:hypothetical protein